MNKMEDFGLTIYVWELRSLKISREFFIFILSLYLRFSYIVFSQYNKMLIDLAFAESRVLFIPEQEEIMSVSSK